MSSKDTAQGPCEVLWASPGAHGKLQGPGGSRGDGSSGGEVMMLRTRAMEFHGPYEQSLISGEAQHLRAPASTGVRAINGGSSDDVLSQR